MRRFWISFALGMAFLACLVDTVAAGSGGTISLPAPPPRGRRIKSSGLLMDIDCNWVEGNGYRPFFVEIRSIVTPAPADRRLSIELVAKSPYGNVGLPKAVQEVVLAEGTNGVNVVLSTLSDSCVYTLDVRVFEDGWEIEDLAFHGAIPSVTFFGLPSEATTRYLFIHGKAPTRVANRQLLSGGMPGVAPAPSADSFLLPDVRGLDTSNLAHDLSRKQTDWVLANYFRQSDRMHLLHPTDLPTRWIDLTCFDVAMVAWGDLSSLAQSDPARLGAVRDWAASGGTLVVYGLGDDLKLAELERVLSTSEGILKSLPVWETPKRRQPGVAFAGNQNSNASAILQTPPPQGAPAAGKTIGEQFRNRSLGLGQVIAMADEDPFPGDSLQWNSILAARGPATANAATPSGQPSGENRLSWFRRHGMSLNRENDDYWRLLIPGLGQAPVWEFTVLISLFALVIGPLNYLWLKRKRRLYLLLVTVPLGAGLVTLGLLGYAILSDGLGVKLRTRSFTRLDQRAGTAASWSWQTYYASLTPSSGLEFPATAVVYPLESAPVPYFRNRHRGKSIEWTDGQRLRGRFLRSRVPGEFLVINTAPSSSGLEVRLGEGALPTVTNRLGVRVLGLVLRGEQETLYFMDLRDQPLGPDKTVSPPESTKKDCESWYRNILRRENELKVPDGFELTEYKNALHAFSSGQYYWADNGVAEPTIHSCLLEQSLGGLADSLDLQPRSYVAIVDRPGEVCVGVGEAQEVSGFHVILGSY